MRPPRCCWGWPDCYPRPTLSPIVTLAPKNLLPLETGGGFLERMWAYATIQKNLNQMELLDAGTEKSTVKQKALDLSLQVTLNFIYNRKTLQPN